MSMHKQQQPTNLTTLKCGCIKRDDLDCYFSYRCNEHNIYAKEHKDNQIKEMKTILANIRKTLSNISDVIEKISTKIGK